MIETVLFDLDATLIDDGPNWRHSVVETAKAVAKRHDLSEANVQQSFYQGAGSIWQKIGGVEAPPWGNMDDPEIVEQIWSSVFATHGIDDGLSLANASDQYLQLRRGHVEAYDDAHACLETLKEKYLLGLVTNGWASQQCVKLATAGLSAYFACVVTTDCGYGKPHPEMFMVAIREMGADPQTTVYVGDSLRSDIVGGQRAHLKTVWLNRKATARKPDDPEPDKTITSLTELPPTLSSWPNGQ
ncbi:MAG: HAD-IA family hydrolase [Candidatus Latescibacteria bacterium]|nr:HAD-IA family hydrolase [Candidatus Latescibacterota bacterium]